MKKILCFDFAGVQFDTLDAQRSYINTAYGINSTPSDYLGMCDDLELLIKKFLPNTKITRDEMYRNLGNDYACSQFWHKDVVPFDGMVEAISELSKKYILWTVTARQSHSKHIIQYLLDKFIPGCMSGIVCVWHYKNRVFLKTPKSDLIKKIPGEKVAFFDDSPKEVLAVKELLPSYLFDPDDIYKNIIDLKKVRSWNEIGKMLL